jgi:archaeosortase A (PGF-CTERM-specific)
MLNKPVVLLGWMILDWLSPYLLWISLLLLLVSALTKKSVLAVLGWALFAVFWLGQPSHYLALEDYFNVFLALIASLLSFYMAWIVLCKGFSSRACYWASYAAAVCGLIYFPFAQVELLKSGLIGFTALLTAKTLQIFHVPVTMESYNIMTLNGRSVEIILACTAIESIALFSGVILSVQASLRRKLTTLATSTIAIYILNIVRNGFVLMAYAWNWFGSDSFNIAHNLIAKFGSAIALLAISYIVFMLLPELLAVLDELASEIKHPGSDAA